MLADADEDEEPAAAEDELPAADSAGCSAVEVPGAIWPPLRVWKKLASETAALPSGFANGRAASRSCSAWLASGDGNLRLRATDMTSAVWEIWWVAAQEWSEGVSGL